MYLKKAKEMIFDACTAFDIEKEKRTGIKTEYKGSYEEAYAIMFFAMSDLQTDIEHLKEIDLPMAVFQGAENERIKWRDKIKTKLLEINEKYKELYETPLVETKIENNEMIRKITTNLDREVYMVLFTVLNELLEEE